MSRASSFFRSADFTIVPYKILLQKLTEQGEGVRDIFQKNLRASTHHRRRGAADARCGRTKRRHAFGKKLTK